VRGSSKATLNQHTVYYINIQCHVGRISLYWLYQVPVKDLKEIYSNCHKLMHSIATWPVLHKFIDKNMKTVEIYIFFHRHFVIHTSQSTVTCDLGFIELALICMKVNYSDLYGYHPFPSYSADSALIFVSLYCISQSTIGTKNISGPGCGSSSGTSSISKSVDLKLFHPFL
jgi:hypothetical protein